jgi:hypothetical protein
MKQKNNEIDEKIDSLIARREEIQKKQLIIYSNNMSNQLFDQLKNQLELIELDLNHYMGLKKYAIDQKKDESDSLDIE